MALLPDETADAYGSQKVKLRNALFAEINFLLQRKETNALPLGERILLCQLSRKTSCLLLKSMRPNQTAATSS
jgi:hypothetical protein